LTLIARIATAVIRAVARDFLAWTPMNTRTAKPVPEAEEADATRAVAATRTPAMVSAAEEPAHPDAIIVAVVRVESTVAVVAQADSTATAARLAMRDQLAMPVPATVMADATTVAAALADSMMALLDATGSVAILADSIEAPADSTRALLDATAADSIEAPAGSIVAVQVDSTATVAGLATSTQIARPAPATAEVGPMPVAAEALANAIGVRADSTEARADPTTAPAGSTTAPAGSIEVRADSTVMVADALEPAALAGATVVQVVATAIPGWTAGPVVGSTARAATAKTAAATVVLAGRGSAQAAMATGSSPARRYSHRRQAQNACCQLEIHPA